MHHRASYHTEEHPIGFYTTGDRMRSWGSTGVAMSVPYHALFHILLYSPALSQAYFRSMARTRVKSRR